MRKSTTSVRLCFLLASLAGVLQAQPTQPVSLQSPGPLPTGTARSLVQPTPAQGVARLNAVLGLSDDQKASILPLLQQLKTELDTLKSSGPSRAAGVDEKQAFINTTATQIRALLTEPQQNTFDAMRPNRLAEIFGN